MIHFRFINIFLKDGRYLDALTTELSAGPIFIAGDFVWVGADNELYLHDPETLDCIKKLKSKHKEPIKTIIKMNSDLGTISQDNSLCIWDSQIV